MKSVLLHINDDCAMGERLAFALDFCRAHFAHLTCLQTTAYDVMAASLPLAGALASKHVFDELQAGETLVRERLEQQLQREDICWDWVTAESDAREALMEAGALHDVMIVSQAWLRAAPDRPLPIVHDLVLAAPCPVLVVPSGKTVFDARKPIVVGWNESPEAANAIRSALPALRLSSQVVIVSVEEGEAPYPQTAASTYLSRHGVRSELQPVGANGWTPAEILTDCARLRGAGLIVMGAFGRSRFREALLGGTTRTLLADPPVPLLLHH